jgi:hypothetical protein
VSKRGLLFACEFRLISCVSFSGDMNQCSRRDGRVQERLVSTKSLDLVGELQTISFLKSRHKYLSVATCGLDLDVAVKPYFSKPEFAVLSFSFVIPCCSLLCLRYPFSSKTQTPTSPNYSPNLEPI